MLTVLGIMLSENYAYQDNSMLKMMMMIQIRNTGETDA
jgi:hypothetical protein